MNLQVWRKHVQTFGIVATAHSAAYIAAKHNASYMVLKCVLLTPDALHPEALQNTFLYETRFLSAQELETISVQSEYGMSKAFLVEALTKGDECYAILDGNTLACFGWYSRKPTRINQDLILEFDPDYAYMYFGFTHPRYRGKRLHALDMGLALQELYNRGSKGWSPMLNPITTRH